MKSSRAKRGSMQDLNPKEFAFKALRKGRFGRLESFHRRATLTYPSLPVKKGITPT
jgi:hypothetical protein